MSNASLFTWKLSHPGDWATFQFIPRVPFQLCPCGAEWEINLRGEGERFGTLSVLGEYVSEWRGWMCARVFFCCLLCFQREMVLSQLCFQNNGGLGTTGLYRWEGQWSGVWMCAAAGRALTVHWECELDAWKPRARAVIQLDTFSSQHSNVTSLQQSNHYTTHILGRVTSLGKGYWCSLAPHLPHARTQLNDENLKLQANSGNGNSCD